MCWEGGKSGIVCTLLLSAGVGEAVEPPTKISKRGAWQDLDFLMGVAGKEGVAFLEGRGEAAVST